MPHGLYWTNDSEKGFAVVPMSGFYAKDYPSYRQVCVFMDREKAEEICDKLNGKEYFLFEYSREIFGGCGKLSRARDAINRHSIRNYVNNHNERFSLDREVDQEPKMFTLWYYMGHDILGRRLKVGGEDYWGHGWSWKQAERLMREFLIALDNGGWDELDEMEA